MTNIDSVLKSKDITLKQKSGSSRVWSFQWSHRLVRALSLSLSIYIYIIKKAEHQSIDAFELWYCRRLPSVHWTARRSNQSILNINPEYLLKGLMLKLKLQYFGHLVRRADSLEKTLILGRLREEEKESVRGWGGWMPSPRQWTWTWELGQISWDGEGQRGLVCCSPWVAKSLRHWATEKQGNTLHI